MKRIIVASKNPVKLEAVRLGFQSIFPSEAFQIEPISVRSEVPNQPRTDDVTRAGAMQRARNARSVTPDAEVWIGIEGGVCEIEGRMAALAWIVALSGNRAGAARTGTFFLPEAVADLVRQGMELGHADDLVFGQTDSKRDLGAVGLLTHGVIDRTSLYAHAVALALIPLRNPELFPPDRA